MIERFDIFLLENDGKPTWLGTAADLKTAQLRISKVASADATQRFLLLDQKTGKKTYVNSQDAIATALPPLNSAESLSA